MIAAGWMMPPPGTRVRQIVASGPFVVQRREDLGAGGCRLTSHPAPRRTEFEILEYSQRGETGLSCNVVVLRDLADDARYVVECGLMGPGLPGDAFVSAGEDPAGPPPSGRRLGLQARGVVGSKDATEQ